MPSRSRSPNCRTQTLGHIVRAADDAAAAKALREVRAADDVATAQAIREAYTAPAQSSFRVAAVIRFRRADGTEGTAVGVNVEPHDANIRGAICAERAALCKFQHDEGPGSEITRVVCVTDSPKPIFPGPLCREYLTSVCLPETEILAAGSADPFKFITASLRDLLPLSSAYCRLRVAKMKELAVALQDKVCAPADSKLADVYHAAVKQARTQKAQESVFPIVFAAAVQFSNGRVHAVSELKAMEYGCTVDAVSLLLPEMLRVRAESGLAAVSVMQADQYGIAHAPFSAARTLLVEHGFKTVLLAAHSSSGEWVGPIEAHDSLPFAFTEWE